MQKPFKELKEGEEFQLPGKVNAFTGKPDVYIKIPFMQNFYKTTGNKRNAKLKVSTSKMNNKYIYVEENQMVEVEG